MLEVLFLMYLGASFIIRVAQYVLTFFSPYNKHHNIWSRYGARPEKESFVSIHLPICNEPPDVVIKTIRSLLQIDYKNFEIIVLDNNTDDESLWKPVERFCEGKERITFVHIPRLEGNKAGAMNKCLEYMDNRTEYILVVDADYLVAPEILNISVNVANTEGTDLLQFPQSYRNTSQSSTLNMEYSSYFKIFMNMANWFRCVLSTGTLAFVRYESLEKIGGWRGDTLTEDAELGVRLLKSGFKTLYIDEEVGHGLTPFTWESLDKQRKRWVTGNIQVLRKNWWELLTNNVLSLKQKAGIFFQLTAWVDYKVLALVLFSLMHVTSISPSVIGIFWGYFIAMILLKVLTFKNTFRGISLKKAFDIFAINQSLIFSMGLSWLKAFLPFELKFEVTQKKGTVNQASTYVESNLTGLLIYSVMILFPLPEDIISSILIAVVLIMQIWSRNYTYKYFERLTKRHESTQNKHNYSHV